MLIFDLRTIGNKLLTIRKRICNVLHITPDEVLTEESTSLTAKQAELWERLNACNPKDKETALQLLSVYLKSLD